ncbi:serine/threonine-protein phosphatase PGAM5, mitochondrial-like isoform X2 [Ruditapes philippinarum]|uniref:serine/threonine-protein phosphatase PGAM5, mitochondrial-like isoform X2 n=1 Tax=Ruditapes philippinarum TaxID=129788 RepID=UPI00295B00C4|nr:serine/threonine-protein phosphatase PGAM5, mitochondrial-like isoform X2 [Ruditapes philippinarum]
MKRLLQKIYHCSKVYGFTAAGAVAIVGIVIYERSRNNPVFSSWTTNHDPSVKWDYNWDKREPESVIKPPKETATDDEKLQYKEKLKKVPTATRHIILIRHGQYYDRESLDINRKLTDLGREQAQLTGARLVDMNYPWSKLICSTMTRAQETADIIHKQLPDLPREECDLLREGAPIPPEPPSGNWRPEKQFYKDGARIEAAFRKYFHRADPEQTNDSYEIVVCHANVIRYFVCRALQFPPEGWLRISLNHASITWLYIRPNGRVGLRTLGEAGFMPVNKVSVL